MNPTYLQPLLQLRLACKRVVDLRGQCGELQAGSRRPKKKSASDVRKHVRMRRFGRPTLAFSVLVALEWVSLSRFFSCDRASEWGRVTTCVTVSQCDRASQRNRVSQCDMVSQRDRLSECDEWASRSRFSVTASACKRGSAGKARQGKAT